MTPKEAFEILRDTPIDIRSAREDDIHSLYATAQNMALDALQKQMWIPCSEMLPELRKDCLVTVKYSGFMGMHGIWVKTGHMEKEGVWRGDCCGGEVIAWMPLPEPYEEGSDE